MHIGLIGCGWAAEHIYLPLFEECPVIRACHVFDLNPVASSLAHRFSKARFTHPSCDALLDRPEIGAVVIAAPAPVLPELVRSALLAGKHTYCEKPLVMNCATAEQLIALSRQRQVVLHVGDDSLYRDDVAALLNTVRAGVIGSVGTLRISWVRKNGVPRRRGWGMERGEPTAGVLCDLGPHLLNVAYAVLGPSRPSRVEASRECLYGRDPLALANWFQAAEENAGPPPAPYTVEDQICADLVTDRRQALHLVLAWAAPVESDRTLVRAEGSQGWVELKTTFGYSPRRWSRQARLNIGLKGLGGRTFHLPSTPETAFQGVRRAFRRFLHEIETGGIETADRSRNLSVIAALEAIHQVARSSAPAPAHRARFQTPDENEEGLS